MRDMFSRLKSQFSLVAALLAAGFVSTQVARADFLVTPTTGVNNVSRWERDVNGNPYADGAAVKAVVGYTGSTALAMLYKATPGSTVAEDGIASFVATYSTVFTPASGDKTGFELTKGTGTAFKPTYTKLYLHVKDGNANPNNYFFDLTALGWDSAEKLVGSNFWPLDNDKGSISHIAIWGGKSSFGGGDPSVPEPASMTMLALGLACLGGRRLLKKRVQA